MKTNGGQYAFPQSNDNNEMHEDYNGMMLRDYFAAKAISVVLAGVGHEEETAKRAYALADAMIEERNK